MAVLVVPHDGDTLVGVSVSRGIAVVILCTLVVAVARFVTQESDAERVGAGQKLDLRALSPGLGASVPMGDLEMVISVPEGEGHTGGSFRAEISQAGFDSGLVPRDGSLEAAWVDDVSGDAKPDVILVVRSGGSGSYASIVVIESSEGSFVVRHLPPLPSTVGYMGHDEVVVRRGQVIRSFPTYVNRSELRVDRQWNARRAANGEWPLKSGQDTNTSPSGKTVELGFDRTTGRWREPA